MPEIPEVKLQYFAAEALALDAARMKALEPNKRYTLATVLLKTRYSQTLDDLAEMFVRQIQQLHQRGKDALAEYRLESQTSTERLLTTLKELLLVLCQERIEG